MFKKIILINWTLKLIIKFLFSVLVYTILKLNFNIVLFNLNIYFFIFYVFYGKFVLFNDINNIYLRNFILSLNLIYLSYVIFKLLFKIKKKIFFDKKYNKLLKNISSYVIFFDVLVCFINLLSINLIYANIFDMIYKNYLLLFIYELIYNIIALIVIFFLGLEISISKFNNLNIILTFKLYIFNVYKFFKLLFNIILFIFKLNMFFIKKYIFKKKINSYVI